MDDIEGAEKTPYERLKELIFSGELLPKQKLTESSLASKLGLSRIPIREAVQQLVFEGFIERNERGGFQLKEFNEHLIIDFFNYREALDGMLTRLFTERMDSTQLYYLELNLDLSKKMIEEKSQDHAAFAHIDMEFHSIIARGARNSIMERQHEIILEKVIYFSDSIRRKNNLKVGTSLDLNMTHEETHQEHIAIVEAIKSRDPEAAEKAARKSINTGLRKVLLLLSQSH